MPRATVKITIDDPDALFARDEIEITIEQWKTGADLDFLGMAVERAVSQARAAVEAHNVFADPDSS